jgi:hypothetical protein
MMIRNLFIISKINQLYKENIIDKETKDILSKIISNNVNSDSLNYMILDVLDNIPENEKLNELISELE